MASPLATLSSSFRTMWRQDIRNLTGLQPIMRALLVRLSGLFSKRHAHPTNCIIQFRKPVWSNVVHMRATLKGSNMNSDRCNRSQCGRTTAGTEGFNNCPLFWISFTIRKKIDESINLNN